MRPITVDKGPLIATLRANREAHRAIFEEALVGYRKVCLKQLNARIREVKAGQRTPIQFFIDAPSDHTHDYDVAIAMLEMDVMDQVELDQQSFLSFVQDDWGWKHSFLTSNSMYSASAAVLLAQTGGGDDF